MNVYKYEKPWDYHWFTMTILKLIATWQEIKKMWFFSLSANLYINKWAIINAPGGCYNFTCTGGEVGVVWAGGVEESPAFP